MLPAASQGSGSSTLTVRLKAGGWQQPSYGSLSQLLGSPAPAPASATASPQPGSPRGRPGMGWGQVLCPHPSRFPKADEGRGWPHQSFVDLKLLFNIIIMILKSPFSTINTPVFHSERELGVSSRFCCSLYFFVFPHLTKTSPHHIT